MTQVSRWTGFSLVNRAMIERIAYTRLANVGQSRRPSIMRHVLDLTSDLIFFFGSRRGSAQRRRPLKAFDCSTSIKPRAALWRIRSVLSWRLSLWSSFHPIRANCSVSAFEKPTISRTYRLMA